MSRPSLDRVGRGARQRRLAAQKRIAQLQRALREVEGLCERANDVIFSYELAPCAGLRYVNPAIMRLTGYSPDAFRNTGLIDRLVHPEDIQQVLRLMDGLDNPAHGNVLLRILAPTGEYLWLELAYTVHLTEMGVRILEGVARPISREQRIAAALARSESQLRGIIDHAPVAIALQRSDNGRFLLVNKTMAAALGASVAEVIDRDVADFFQGELLEQWRERDREILAKGSTLHWEDTHPGLDGASRTVLATKFPLSDPELGIYAIGGFYMDISSLKHIEAELRSLNEDLEVRVLERTRDITVTNMMLRNEIEDRELFEQELRESRNLLRTIFDHLEDGLALIGRDGQPLVVNAALRRYYAVTAGAAEEPWQALQRLVMPLAEATFAEKRPQHRRERYEMPDGRSRLLDIHTLPVGGEGLSAQVLVHLIDATERVQLEQLTMQNEQLVASSRLAAVVAHEVNTPLQAIQNLLFLADLADGPALHRYIELVREEIERIGTLLYRLLDYHRPDDGTLQELRCNDLIERVLLLTGSVLTKKRIIVERDLAPDLPLVLGQRNMLTQVFLNLIWNAIDALAAGGMLRLQTRGVARPAELIGGAAPLAVQVCVCDTGAGIPMALQSRIFDPFFTTKTEGTGLGLAVSQQIIRQHGGHIEVESTVGTGTVFRVTLPQL